MGGRSKRVTIGYRYLLGMQQVYCHGPVDSLREIRVDDRQAFSGAVKEGELLINKGNLFGGDEREGGVRGLLDVEFGGPEQQPNSYLVSKLGSLVPAFRGVTQLVLKQVEMGMNPYLKPWSATFQRIFTRQDGIEQWYRAKAPIGKIDDVALYLALDVSGSMGWGENDEVADPSRLDLAKQALSAALDGLVAAVSSANIDVMIVGWGNTTTSILRRNIDKQDIVDLQSFVNALAATGTATDFEQAVNDAPAFFDGAGGKPRVVVFMTDGEPSPVGSVALAKNTLFSISGVQSYGVNMVLEDTTYTAEMDNTADDGVPVIPFDNFAILVNTIMATITGHIDLNPAHIIRECNTDPGWGMGYSESEIDEASFVASANKLFSEGMGISILWDRQSPLEDFVADITRHIDAVHDIDRRTGKFRLKLIRDDYTIDELLTLGPAQIEKVENYGRPSPGDVINQVTVRYWDATTRSTQSVTVEDTALVARDGGIINRTVDYPGFTRADVATRVAARDLRAESTPLLSATLFCDQTADELSIGEPFIFEWPELHDPGIVMRVTEIAYGDGVNNQIRIDCIEDVFAVSDNVTIGQSDSEWVDPVSDPQTAQNRIVFEAPYYELVQDRGQSSVDERLTENPDIGIVMAAAVRPADDSINAAMYTDSGTGYEQIDVLDFCPTATLSAEVGPVDAAWTIQNGVDLGNVEIGTHCQIADELCSVLAIDADGGTMTVGRAVLDTVPNPVGYPAGTRIYFWDEFGAADPREYATAEQIDVKLLPTTGIGQLDIADAPADQVTIQQRAYLPYPPGNLKVNAEYFPETIGGAEALALTWAHRDRAQQTAGELVHFTQGDVGPEAGVTYTLRVYGENDTLGNEITAISSTSYTYPVQNEADDFRLPSDGTLFGDPTATRDAMGASLSGTNKWQGAVTADNGKVYCIPLDSTDILIIDPDAGTATRDAMGASLSGTLKWATGVKANNGKIYASPYHSTDILIIDPDAGTATRDAMGASLSGTFKWLGGALADNGKIYYVPEEATDILIIDPDAGTATRDAMGANLSGSSKWIGAVKANNGKIYGIPFNSTDILIIDPDAGTATRDAMGANLSGGSKWFGGVLGADGKIYGIPSNSADILVIDPDAGTADRVTWGASLSGSGKWIGGFLGPNDLIYGVPASSADILIIDPVAESAVRDSFSLSLSGSTKWRFGAVTGAFAYGAPSHSTDVLVMTFEEPSFRLNGRLRFELESVRDGVTSFQNHNVEVRRPGWSFNWDMYWDGGAP